MGIDAKMFVRLKGRDNWLDETTVRRLSYELASSIGADQFMILWPGEFDCYPNGKHALGIIEPFVDEYDEAKDLVGKIVWIQDGPPIIAGDDEQFVKVNLRGRYYGPGYERGNWPILRSIAEWLETNIPSGSVWYGGDSSGVCAEPFNAARRAEYALHWATKGRRPYVHSGWRSAQTTDCPHCKAPLANCGGGKDFDFLWCDGCDRKASLHKDGRLVWAIDRHHDYPTFNADGEPQQRKDIFK